MLKTTGILALGFVAIASAALAHSGARGVVLERMQGMTAMRDIIRDLSPVMQGTAPYDALTVSEAGYVIARHAGETMQVLFPDGSLEGVTYAKPNIWTDWDEFAALAEELRIYGDALSNAAPNGLAPVARVVNEKETSPIKVAAAPNISRTRKIAELLGYAEAKPGALSLDPLLNVSQTQQPNLSDIGASKIFEQISGACSACHARFRKGRS